MPPTPLPQPFAGQPPQIGPLLLTFQSSNFHVAAAPDGTVHLVVVHPCGLGGLVPLPVPAARILAQQLTAIADIIEAQTNGDLAEPLELRRTAPCPEAQQHVDGAPCRFLAGHDGPHATHGGAEW